MEPLQKGLQNAPSDSPIPAVAPYGQILYIGVAGAVADRPSHAYDILSFQGSHKRMTACNQPRDELRAFVIARLPPLLRPIEFFDLSDLVRRRRLKNNRFCRLAIRNRHYLASLSEQPCTGYSVFKSSAIYALSGSVSRVTTVKMTN
jgi:hypothetical protein